MVQPVSSIPVVSGTCRVEFAENPGKLERTQGEKNGAMDANAILSDQSVVVAAKDQVSCDLAGEAAILNVKSGIYYGLDPVGARIWSLVQQPRAVAEIQNAIAEEYEVEPAQCARDLRELLEKLLAEGLIEVKDGSAG